MEGWREGEERRRERGRMEGGRREERGEGWREGALSQCQAISQVEHSHKERKGCWFSGGSSCEYCGINSTCLI